MFRIWRKLIKMGSSQSTPVSNNGITEEERKRRSEQQQREREAEQRRKQEEERLQRERQETIKKEVDQRLKDEKEQERQRRLEEKEENKRHDEKEATYKQMEFKHLEESQKLKDIEQCNERKDTLETKRVELEHERLMQGQTEVLSIVGETFKRAPVTNMNEVAYAAYILQCIQNNKEVDMKVLELVASKVNNPPPLNLEQIVDKAIERTIQEEENSEDGYPAYQRPPKSDMSTVMMVDQD